MDKWKKKKNQIARADFSITMGVAIIFSSKTQLNSRIFLILSLPRKVNQFFILNLCKIMKHFSDIEKIREIPKKYGQLIFDRQTQ